MLEDELSIQLEMAREKQEKPNGMGVKEAIVAFAVAAAMLGPRSRTPSPVNFIFSYVPMQQQQKPNDAATGGGCCARLPLEDRNINILNRIHER